MKKLMSLACGLIFACTFAEAATNSAKEDFQFQPECYVHFSPKGGATAAIVNRINLAEKEVLVQAYNYASIDIADALIAAKNRGVKVNLLIDGKQPTANGNQLQYSKDHSLTVNLDKKHAISHNKVIIIDQQWVHTGSFNFSANAENRNAENSVWCLSPDMAKIYINNFNVHLAHGVSF